MKYSEEVYRYRFTIPEEAVDENGHVNNVTYVQWMQDAAVRHYEAMGGREPIQAINATWVVRKHTVEYLRPAFAGEEIEVRTWVVDMWRVRSTRRYEFVRVGDGAELVRGETEWVFVDATTGRPRSVDWGYRGVWGAGRGVFISVLAQLWCCLDRFLPKRVKVAEVEQVGVGGAE